MLRIIKIILNLITEYLLIAEYKIRGFLSKELPSTWKSGEVSDVLIIQGLNEYVINFREFGDIANKLGFRVHGIDLHTRATVANIAQQYINFIKENDLRDIVIVCHSKGGIISKFLLDNYPEINKRVSKVISIAVPFGGSGLGWIPIWNIPELGTNSKFIKKLLQKTENNVKFLNLYSELDNHVILSDSLRLSGADNRLINIIGHTRILRSEETKKIYTQALEQIRDERL